MLRTFAIAAAASILVAGTAFAAAPKHYPGTARKLTPTQKDVSFKTLVANEPSKKPPAGEQTGFKTGWTALYEKGTAKAPTEAVATIYVYSSAADAKIAWTKACSKCKTVSAPGGLTLKAEAGTSSGIPTLHEVTRCSNVYLDVLESTDAGVTAIDNDVVKITNAVYARAIAGGLTSCAAK